MASSWTSGLLVLRKLRQVASAPVIIGTADASERSVVRGLRSGADDYLARPRVSASSPPGWRRPPGAP